MTDEFDLEATYRTDEQDSRLGLTRRQVVGRGLSAASALAAGSLVAACGGSASSRPARGGQLRVGITGNGSLETFSPAIANADIDAAHVYQVFEPLTTFNDKGLVVNLLAEEI